MSGEKRRLLALRQTLANQGPQGLLPFDFDEGHDCDEVTGRARLRTAWAARTRFSSRRANATAGHGHVDDHDHPSLPF